MFLKVKHKISGFTLIELLIVVAIIAILAGLVLLANINSTYQKARDSKRKQDLNKLSRTFEDYYNDHGQYPPANNPPNGQIASAPWGSAFAKYVPQLPSDPLSPNSNYYYQVASAGNFYVLYAKLENTADPDIVRVGCQNGCGPKDSSGNRAFNYFVSSGDVMMASGIPNGQDPGVLPGVPTPTPAPVTPGGPTPTPNCPSGQLCCGNNQCCAAPWYCGPQQCPGNNNVCLFDVGQWKYLCSYNPTQCP